MTHLFRTGRMGLLLLGLLMACSSPYTPKKKGYFRIELPEHRYQAFSDSSFPYSFEYPVYGTLVRDSTYFDATPENGYWLNIDFTPWNARLFLSYKIIGGQAPFKIRQPDGTYRDSMGVNRLDKMVADAFHLTAKNDVAATSISDSAMRNPAGVTGVMFRVGGNAATATQFFLTDSVRHFIRGALYFHATPNADSTRPVQEFLHRDVEHLVRTFRWRTPKP